MGLIAAVAAGVLAPAAAAAAQDRDGGFWGSFGTGHGWNATPPPGATQGSVGFLRLGGTVNSRLLLGGETIGWMRSSTTSGGNLTLTVLLYPKPNSGLLLKGGVGFGFSRADEQLPTFVSNDTRWRQGLGTTLGVGWEIRVRGNFYLALGVDWLLHLFYDDGNEHIQSPNHFLLLHVGPMWH